MRKLHFLLLVVPFCLFATPSFAWFFVISSQSASQLESKGLSVDQKPEVLMKIIADLQQRTGFRALAYALIDTSKGRQWVWGYQEAADSQELANRAAMNSCVDRMRFVRESLPAQKGVFEPSGRTLCDFHTFQDVPERK